MATFDYLIRVLIDSLSRFEHAHENAFLGVAVCSIVEFLGRCIRDPSDSKNGYQNFQRFISDYLSKEDVRYKKYEYLLYQDLRHGAAHAVLPKGGVTLSFEGQNLHLRLVKNKNTSLYHLWIYSPKLINDLKSTIFKFVEAARNNKKLEHSYLLALQYIQMEGQKIVNELGNEELKVAVEENIQGDIKA